jgi:hypothetical protein
MRRGRKTLVGCHSYLTIVLVAPPLLPAKRLNFMLTPGFGGGMTDAKLYVGQRTNDREDCPANSGTVRGELAGVLWRCMMVWLSL